MAQIAIALTILFFFLFAISYTPTSSDSSPENGIRRRYSTISPPKSGIDPTILLPTNTIQQTVTFRPINRHFPIKRVHHFRPRHCHHHFKPYGDETVISGKRVGSNPAVFGGGFRQVPPMWVGFHHHNRHHRHRRSNNWIPSFSFMRRDGIDKINKYFLHEEERLKDKAGFDVVKKGIRKFMNHF